MKVDHQWTGLPCKVVSSPILEIFVLERHCSRGLHPLKVPWCTGAPWLVKHATALWKDEKKTSVGTGCLRRICGMCLAACEEQEWDMSLTSLISYFPVNHQTQLNCLIHHLPVPLHHLHHLPLLPQPNPCSHTPFPPWRLLLKLHPAGLPWGTECSSALKLLIKTARLKHLPTRNRVVRHKSEENVL